MSQLIVGPGVGLPLPASLYPTNLAPTNNGAQINGVNNQNTNKVSLAAGETLLIPAGTWSITPGIYSQYQIKDPVTGTWQTQSPRYPASQLNVRSDGVNHRVANLTNCPIAAVVTNAGSGYVQASTSVNVTGGNSTWQAVVGGLGTSINPVVTAVTGTTVTLNGAGYGMAPYVFVPAPSSSGVGVQATAIAAITTGSVSSYTVVNQGGGYSGSSVTVQVLPNPLDPNFLNGSITSQAQAYLNIGGGGSIAALLCTSSGAALAGGVTLTIAGVGASATATAQVLKTVTGTSISVVGAGYGAAPMLQTSGGRNTAVTVNVNPDIEITNFIPRPARAALGIAGTSISLVTIDDPGLFISTPNSLVLAQDDPTTIGVVALTLGGATDTVILQNI